MTTTLTPRRVTTPPEIDMDELRSGLSNATGTGVKELETASDEWDYETGDHPALLAWDDVIEEAISGIAPEVARMLTEAIQRRLPWTWEPDR